MDKQTAAAIKPKKVSPRTGTSAKPTKAHSVVTARTVAKQSATYLHIKLTGPRGEAQRPFYGSVDGISEEVMVNTLNEIEVFSGKGNDKKKTIASASERAKAARQASKAPRMSAKALIALGLYYATELERVTIIRQGLPANILVQIGRAMDISNDLLFSTLALPRSTVVRKIQNNETLSVEQSERVVGLERLVGQVEAMVKQSGNAEGFDAWRWVGDWLQRPLPALGGEKPAEFMDTIEGQNLVARFLAQSQSGAYA